MPELEPSDALDYQREDGWPAVTKKGWQADEFDTEAASVSFTSSQLAVMRELVERSKRLDLAATQITREFFDHPVLHATLASWVSRFKQGQGLLVIKGFPVAELPLDDIWRMYWGIGAHFGIGVSQNLHGQLQGTVTVQPGVVGERVYGVASEAPLHSDRIDILSLLCIHRAKQGGENAFVSSLKVWELIESERPDLLPILLKGFPQVRNGEQPEGDSPVTPYRVPIFGEAQGVRSCYFGGNAMLRSVERSFSELLDEQDRAALTYLGEVLQRPELRLKQMLEQGEAVFINNMEMLHSRTAFIDGDGPGQKRLLLRMWLQGRPCRPIPRDMRVLNNRSGMLGVEPR